MAGPDDLDLDGRAVAGPGLIRASERSEVEPGKMEVVREVAMRGRAVEAAPGSEVWNDGAMPFTALWEACGGASGKEDFDEEDDDLLPPRSSGRGSGFLRTDRAWSKSSEAVLAFEMSSSEDGGVGIGTQAGEQLAAPMWM